MKIFFQLLVVWIILLISSIPSPGQNKQYPVQFNPLLLKNYSFINPASTNTDSRFEINTANILTTGDFADINQFFINASLNLNKDSAGMNQFNKNTLGATFYTEREGYYLRKNYGYVNYARHQRLGYKFTVGVGASLGFLGYAYDTTNTSAGASDYDLDANVGIWIYSENFTGGFSINQIMNNDIQPLVYTFLFARYYNLNAAKRLMLSHDFYIQPTIQIRWEGASKQWYDIGTLAVFSNRLMTGINYKHKYAMSYMAGVKELSIYRGKLQFDFSFNYQTLLNRAGLGNRRTIEVALNFRLPR